MSTEQFFFSYAREDSEFALRLARDLRQAGAKVWIDQLDLEAGTRWDRAIEDALEQSTDMIVVLSPTAVASNNVMDEVSYALEEQKRVVPVVYQKCDIPFRLRRLQYVSVVDAHDEALDRVLEALDVDTASGGRLPDAGATAAASSPPAIDDSGPERRQVTMLVCDVQPDLEGDPEARYELEPVYLAACEKVIGRFGGELVPYAGNGLAASFGFPLAHEDDVARAVRAGLGIIESVEALRSRANGDGGLAMHVRVSAHTAVAVVEAAGADGGELRIVGAPLQVATQLQALTEPGQLIVSESTFVLIDGIFNGRPGATQDFQGSVEPLTVYQVLHESGARARMDTGAVALTDLVGRGRELGLLTDLWAALGDGVGEVVLVTGAAGVGKSRLIRDLEQRAAEDPSAWLIECRSSPYHRDSPLHPVIDLLERVVLGFGADDGPKEKLDKIDGLMAQYSTKSEETVPLFASLLSVPLDDRYPPLNLNPELQKQKTLQLLLQTIMRRAQQQPVLLVFEDLHWADPTSLDLIELIIAQGPAARILTVLTTRPEFTPTWGHQSDVVRITLNRLSRQDRTDMIGQITGGRELPQEVLNQIVDRCDGVPLFIEELTLAVLESPWLERGPDRFELRGPLPKFAVPATLQATLNARLDRLEAAKPIAQVGAVLGREFSHRLIDEVSPLDGDALDAALQQLVDTDMLYQRGFPPEATYVFKHALIQDAAYSSLLTSARHQYHQQIAQTLEERFPAVAATQPEILAHHYTEAGIGEHAIPYWLRGGIRAMTQSANQEAVNHLNKGLAVLESMPEGPNRTRHELDLQSTLGATLLATRGFSDTQVEVVYSRVQELCDDIGEEARPLTALWGLWAYHFTRGDLQKARDLVEQQRALTEPHGDPIHRVASHACYAYTMFFLGEFTSSRENLEHALALYETGQHHSYVSTFGMDLGVSSAALLGWVLWTLGYPDQAGRQARDAIALAEEVGHPLTSAFPYFYATTVYRSLGDSEAARSAAEAEVALSAEHGLPYWLAQGGMLLGAEIAIAGDAQEGLARFEQASAVRDAIGGWLLQPYFLSVHAELQALNGRHDAGLAMLGEALAVTARTGEAHWEAEIRRSKGVLSLEAGGDDSQAEAWFEQALEVSRSQGAKSLELRAAISLARLFQRQGKSAEGLEQLVAVYEWFTEGFDTGDLREARALIEQLRAADSVQKVSEGG